VNNLLKCMIYDLVFISTIYTIFAISPGTVSINTHSTVAHKSRPGHNSTVNVGCGHE
jgi:hypothetical protein